MLAAGLARRFARHQRRRGLRSATSSSSRCPPLRTVCSPTRRSAARRRSCTASSTTPPAGLVRADLVVQWQVARALGPAGRRRAASTSSAQSWAPWWCFRRARRLPAKLFRPAPSVDAAVLTVTRREPSLLPGRGRAGVHGLRPGALRRIGLSTARRSGPTPRERLGRAAFLGRDEVHRPAERPARGEVVGRSLTAAHDRRRRGCDRARRPRPLRRSRRPSPCRAA